MESVLASIRRLFRHHGPYDPGGQKQCPGDIPRRELRKTVNRSAFDDAVAKSWGKESVKAIKLTCNGNPAYLTEMQISLNASTINNPLAAASFAPRPHPGNCGKQFIIDKVGY
ncbi:ribonuclease T2 [Enterobacter cancerogenus]|uniref:Ribonuclease T2 n=1 Tax=Enterobacter cancerogenus TaxID=69218 RepID=A0A484X2U6_9ENTR|nr:ribonuclease T2 [Enterobacter cancerogenus]